jgi:calcineurin-like phosphoesterase family protein
MDMAGKWINLNHWSGNAYTRGDNVLYFLGDTHFNHANIIKYSNRPFKNVEEMNHILVENWVDVVNPEDKVIFLGDFAMGRYESLLRAVSKCEIEFIRGNHDKKFRPPQGLKNKKYLTADDGTQFLIIHEPEDTPQSFGGWVIHGHHHNNWMDDFPFFNPIRGTINVSVDVIGYRPISFDDIMYLTKTQHTPILTRP